MSRRRRQRRADELGQLPWRQARHEHGTLPVLDSEAVETIHEASLDLLECVGIEVCNAAARRRFGDAGALVEGELVRIGRDLIETTIASAPDSVTLTPRNPARSITLGGDLVAFGLVAGPPFVHDLERGRRASNMGDYEDFIRLAQHFNAIHMLGNQVAAPLELPVESRHLDTYFANLQLTDMSFHCTAIGRARAMDGIEMMAIARGVTLDEIATTPGVATIININSPRRLDDAMAEGLMTMAELGQLVSVTPFTLMGAMTPATLGAALVQQNAEALLGIALTQLVRPGAPVMYGAFTSNVDMRSGAPAFGTPENAKANVASGQLARRYGLPYRSSNANASNTVDAQAAYETQMALWGAVLGGANLIYHAAGWLEGGLVASYEKLIIDIEMLQQMSEFLTPIDVSPASLGLDAIERVPAGGHFFGDEHTLERYETAFYEPLISDWRPHEAWVEAGSPTAAERATVVWKQALASYEQPHLDSSVTEELTAFVARRKQEIARGS